ncbi:hypothetical protein FDECE_6033 [Fusarium decemcellulare]|nr:hypothetical protein FDECE_6033 [Fusarium decemcellulare]
MAGEVTIDSLDRIIWQAESLVERLVASKTALQQQQHDRPSSASLRRSQVKAALHDLASIAQNASRLSASYLSTLGPDDSDDDDDEPAEEAPAIATAAPLQSVSQPTVAVSRTPLPPSPPSNASDLSVISRPSLQAPAPASGLRPHSPPSSEAEIEPSISRRQQPAVAGTDEDEEEPRTKRKSTRDCPGHLNKKPKASTGSKADNALALAAGHSAELSKLILKLKGQDKLCHIPVFSASDPPTATLLQRAAAIQGGPAIRQFCSFVVARRDRETEMNLLHTESQGIERAVELWRSIGKLTAKAALNSFMLRLAQCQMATAVDGTKLGRIRADPSEIDKMMKKFGFNESERKRFATYLRQGRVWQSVCGRFPGLLCLIPVGSYKPYCVSGRDYLNMRGDELDRFAKLIDTPYMARINQACEALQDMVLGVKDDMVFKWEKEHPELPQWDKSLSDDILLSLLQPHEYCEENQYDGREFPDWARPTGWPAKWPWQVNPLVVISAEHQCDLCNEPKCRCLYTKLVRRRPRIKSWDKQGLGLQAVAAREGEMAYRKGEVIGQICGKIVPSGTYPHNTSFVMDMHRPDLAGEPIVCQIYVASATNCFRYLNHCCRASARVRPLRVSGHWICGIEAIRDIRHGEQITANFGKRFLRTQGLRCECEACRETT